VARLRLRCSDARCEGNVRLWYHNVRLGTTAYRLAAGQTGTFSVPLGTHAMRLLAKAGPRGLEAGQTVTVTGGATVREGLKLVG
jgi:hypothetical protein